MPQSSKTSRVIKASPEKLYQALTDPTALESWQVPGNMTGKAHQFELKVGGGYTMSLYYPESEKEGNGKTSTGEDRFTVKFLELDPPARIVESVKFETTDPDFMGEMMIEISIEPVTNGTKVTYLFTNIPKGIRPEDNDAGTASSLEKLAKYVE